MLNKTVHSDKTNTISVASKEWEEREKEHKAAAIEARNNSPSKNSVPNNAASPISKQTHAVINKWTTWVFKIHLLSRALILHNNECPWGFPGEQQVWIYKCIYGWGMSTGK